MFPTVDFKICGQICGLFVTTTILIFFVCQKKLNIKPEECMAFGDQMNDYELFQNVHYSYAMKNAIQPLKEIAFQVIDSNDEAGVTRKIKEILKGEL